jgi:DNA-binding transcriptional regulator YiaG
MESRLYRHVEQIGKATVTDETTHIPQCTACGEVELTTEQLAGFERRAAARVLYDGRHANGTTVRYARKALGLKQTELAALLGYDGAWVSRVENGAMEIPQVAALALVALLDEAERDPDAMKRKLELVTSEDNGEPSIRNFEVRRARTA